jgi:hypothetical protein
MKKTMKTHCWMFGLVTAGCTFCMMLPPRAIAEVNDTDFNALKETVSKLGEQVQDLQQSNQVQQQIHQQDVQQLQHLQQKLTETQQVATNAEQKSIEASMTQPLPRQPIDEATVNHNFMMLGDAEFQFVKAKGQNGAFVLADFAPIFLYRAGDNILFEVGFDAVLQNDSNGLTPSHDSGSSTSFGLSFAQIDYVMNNYMTFEAGQLLLPLGTYSERTAGWLNMIPDDPLAVSLIPGSGVGVELQGAMPMGNSGDFFNYQVYGVNGPSSSDGSGDPTQLDLGGNVGLKSDNTVANLHGNPSGGGRLGFFMPFPYKPHYDLEVGVSGQTGEWDDAGQYLWSANVYDAALHLGPNFVAKGEYIMTWYGSTAGVINQKGWYAQVGYKLAGLDWELPLINNTELVGRYDYENDGMGTKTKRYTAGFVYYITNTLLFEGDYEFLNSNDPAQNDADQLILQLSLGF